MIHRRCCSHPKDIESSLLLIIPSVSLTVVSTDASFSTLSLCSLLDVGIILCTFSVIVAIGCVRTSRIVSKVVLVSDDSICSISAVCCSFELSSVVEEGKILWIFSVIVVIGCVTASRIASKVVFVSADTSSVDCDSTAVSFYVIKLFSILYSLSIINSLIFPELLFLVD